ncbi:hypothetical protein OSTOST_03434 [Ostertagia ostertagi]
MGIRMFRSSAISPRLKELSCLLPHRTQKQKRIHSPAFWDFQVH